MRLAFRPKSLRLRIIAWSFVPTTIILLAVALVTFLAYQQVAADLVVGRNGELTRLSAGQLSTQLAEYSDLLASLARTADIYRNDPAARKLALNRARNRLVVFDGGSVILDTYGKVVAAEPERPDALGQDWSDRSYFRRLLRTTGPVLSDIVADGPGGADVIAVAVPITGEQGELEGTLVGMFRLGASAVSSFYGSIVRLRLGDGGQAWLIDGQGRVIYDSDPTRIGQSVKSQPIVVQVLGGKVGAGIARDASGRSVVASYAPVPGTAWELVSLESWATLSAASLGYTRFLVVLLVAGVVVPTLVVLVGVGRITRPIRDLIEAARQVAGGNFGQAISARTGDEIELLAEQFNRMSAELQESYGQLERRVADRTRELAALNTVAAVVSGSLDLEEILQAALEKAMEVSGMEFGAAYRLEERTQALTIIAHRGLPHELADWLTQRPVGPGVATEAAATQRPVVLEIASYPEGEARRLFERVGMKLIAGVPLTAKGMTVGAMSLATRAPRHLSPEDLSLMAAVGQQIGVAIAHARLFEAEQRRADQFRVIGELGRRITSILVVDELLGEVARLIKERLGYYMVGIGLVEGDEVVMKAGAGPCWETPGFQCPHFPVGGDGLIGSVAGSGEVELVPDVTREPRHYSPPHADEARSELVLPLRAQDAVLGVLDVQSDRLHAFDENDLAMLEALASQAAIAIQNARLYERAEESAAAAERNRLARDLHDAVTQTLFSASLIAEVLPRLWQRNPDEGRRRLDELRQLTRGALAEMRTLLLELRPAALTEAPLANLLRHLAEATTGRARIPVSLDVEGQQELPPDVHVGLYRIAQEALNNIAKHSDASRAEMWLRCEPDRVELRIADDGQGFDRASVARGSLGLGIMRERAQAIGATLSIESVVDQGTEVKVSWCQARAAEEES